jgi:hypothetical protein
MATLQSRFSRLQSSLPGAEHQPGIPVTTVTPLRQIPSRQAVPRSTGWFIAKEPEDARLTGGTRSLDRRLLALNIAGSLASRSAKLGAAKAEVAKSETAADRIGSPFHSAVA